MKKILIYILSVTAISITSAFLTSNKAIFNQYKQNTLKNNTSDTYVSEVNTNNGSENSAESTAEDFLVLDTESDSVVRVSAKDYVIGAVAAEMPAEFETEALKAQSVAAFTYAIRQKKISSENKNSELHGADFSDDPEKYQAFYSNDELKDIWGNKYEEYYNKICSAVDDVLGVCIYYEDEPVIAAFHSISSGKTENAKDVWGTDVPYLISVDSTSDTEVSGYQTEVKISADETFKILSELCEKNIDSDKKSLFSNIERSSTDYVLSAEFTGKIISGEDLRTAFDLRSSNFSVSYNEENDEYIFTVKGYGHGVGMSQYGAEKMAESGCSWQDILSHYYPNTYLEKI